MPDSQNTSAHGAVPIQTGGDAPPQSPDVPPVSYVGGPASGGSTAPIVASSNAPQSISEPVATASSNDSADDLNFLKKEVGDLRNDVGQINNNITKLHGGIEEIKSTLGGMQANPVRAASIPTSSGGLPSASAPSLPSNPVSTSVAGSRTVEPMPSYAGDAARKFCPKTGVLMGQVKIYGVRVDVSPEGIWFDSDELTGILKGHGEQSIFAKLKRIFQPDILERIRKLQEWEEKYHALHVKAQEVQRKINTLPQSDQKRFDELLPEYRTLINQLTDMHKVREGVPDLTGDELVDPGKIPDGGPTPELNGTPSRLCPKTGKMLCRVLLFGQELDVSEAGIWFDKGELVHVVGELDKKGQLPLVGNMFKNNLRKKIDAAINAFHINIEARDKVFLEYQEAQKELDRGSKPDLIKEVNRLRTEYDEANNKLYDGRQKKFRPVDITPSLLG